MEVRISIKNKMNKKIIKLNIDKAFSEMGKPFGFSNAHQYATITVS